MFPSTKSRRRGIPISGLDGAGYRRRLFSRRGLTVLYQRPRSSSQEDLLVTSCQLFRRPTTYVSVTAMMPDETEGFT